MIRRGLLLLIVLLAAFLRLYRFTTAPPGLYRDEAMDGCNALEALETGRFQPFYPEDGGREGLYVNLAAIPIRLFGNVPWAVRLPAAVAGILTVWAVGLLGGELFSAPVGLLAAFFLATSFWHLNFSRISLRGILAPCLLAWAIYLLLVGIRRSRWWLVALAGVVYGLGFYTYMAYRVTPLLIALVLLARKPGWRAAGAFAAPAVVVAIPLLIYFVEHPGTFWGRAAQVSVFAGPHPAREIVLNAWRTGRMLLTRGDHNWRHNVAWQRELFWPVAILFVVGLIFAAERLTVWWLILGALPAIFSMENPHALRALLMVVPACLLAAAGAVWVARRIPRRAAIAAGALLVAACCYDAWHTYFVVWARNPNVAAAFDVPSIALAAQINGLSKRAPRYVTAAPPPDDTAVWPVMYLTRSCTVQEQQETGIRYVSR